MRDKDLDNEHEEASSSVVGNFQWSKENGSKRITGVFISKQDICYVKQLKGNARNGFKCICPLIFHIIQIWFQKVQ